MEGWYGVIFVIAGWSAIGIFLWSLFSTAWEAYEEEDTDE